MKASIEEIGEVIEQLLTSIEYLNEHVSSANTLSHTVLPIQRKIKEINQQLKIQRSQNSQNKQYISQLCEEEHQLHITLKEVSTIELNLSSALASMSSFIEKHKVRKDILTKYSEKELQILSNLHTLNIASSLNQGRMVLNKYVAEVSDNALIDLLNVKFRLSGYKRFYYEDGKVNSKYCIDLKSTLLQIFDKKNFRELVDIIKGTYGAEQRQLKPIEVLKIIIKYYNKRKV